MRARISLRTGSPNTASASSISPTVLFSKLVTADFIVLFLLLRRLLGRGIRRRRTRSDRRRERQILRRRPLLGIADQHIAAIGAGDRPLDHDQAALGIDRDDLQVLGRDPLIAEMARHLLAREGTAGILAVAGRAMGAMRDRHAMGRPEAAEIVALHHAGKALADAVRRDVDELAGLEMLGRER